MSGRDGRSGPDASELAALAAGHRRSLTRLACSPMIGWHTDTRLRRSPQFLRTTLLCTRSRCCVPTCRDASRRYRRVRAPLVLNQPAGGACRCSGSGTGGALRQPPGCDLVSPRWQEFTVQEGVMKQPGQPPNWGRQQQQRQQQQWQQQRRQAAGYAWQKQKREREQAERWRAQQPRQHDLGFDWQSERVSMPTVEQPPHQRSCLSRLARMVGILLALGVCLLIAAVVLSSL